MDLSKTFSNPQEEIKYWKTFAIEYKRGLDEAHEELDEFQVSSRDLEAELETQLEQVEKKNKELTSTNGRLQMELESIQEKLEQQHQTTFTQISDLQNELAQVKGYRDELQRYIRELEQANDDLERAKRATVVSLEDFELRLNQAIERNAFLESELDEKELLQTTIQRLKDESRDLKQELAITKVDSDEELHEPENHIQKIGVENAKDLVENEKDVCDTSNSTAEIIDSNKVVDSLVAQSPPKTPTTPTNKGFPPYTPGGSTPLSTSSRISALNIVGDLLRKVGALESKLAACRNFMKDQPQNIRRTNTPSPLNSPRAKRLNRGATSGSSNNTQSGLVKVAL
ncbi:nuclear distribution protein nudE homolog 1-like isoform X2 [Tubulanus polymorphus]|uniref:nuclear distribution protein nudE homolog 1-like isoform X2 n=1 Tax=Tubulanus polymorphus TaxID=672921 RepID=UPI003DA2C8B1